MASAVRVPDSCLGKACAAIGKQAGVYWQAAKQAVRRRSNVTTALDRSCHGHYSPSLRLSHQVDPISMTGQAACCEPCCVHKLKPTGCIDLTPATLRR